ncbi:glycosyltransferase family 39 protein [Candidatus Sumerlaeota bacterium]|nr:glycosyltransferase family 39 protein [Candidatus Sumerlaeota bacterium]
MSKKRITRGASDSPASAPQIDDDPAAGVSPPDEPWDRPYQNQIRWFLILMAVSVIFRLGLLFYSQKYLQSDEALVGMIALDIMEGAPIPLFPYGNDYAGGHIFEALWMIPFFKIFGPSDVIVAGVPAMISCVWIAVVYFTLYRFFGKRLALLASLLFSFSSAFVAYNYYVNGSMTTMLFSWIGMYFFFDFYFARKEKLISIGLAGVALGFGYYCFDYALFFLFGALFFWALKEKFEIWRQWKSILSFMAGYIAGASPLLYHNFTHNWANFRNLFNRTAEPNAQPILISFFVKFARLLSHDLPSFFSVDIYDFSREISPVSYVAHAVFVISAIFLVAALWRPLFEFAASCLRLHTPALGKQERIIYVAFLSLIYMTIYSVSSSGGRAPRYLLPLYPLIPVMIAWTALELFRRFRPAAFALLAVYGITQFYFIAKLAADKTTTEWYVTTHGADIKELADYLEKNNLTTIIAPYEVKWKVMFASNRKVVCASHMFGYDREVKYNLEVIDRVNRQGLPFAFVSDKDYKLPRIALNFNPRGAFDMEGFQRFLQANGILYEITRVGRDYVVWHNFSKHFNIPDPYHAPPGSPGR